MLLWIFPILCASFYLVLPSSVSNGGKENFTVESPSLDQVTPHPNSTCPVQGVPLEECPSEKAEANISTLGKKKRTLDCTNPAEEGPPKKINTTVSTEENNSSPNTLSEYNCLSVAESLKRPIDMVQDTAINNESPVRIQLVGPSDKAPDFLPWADSSDNECEINLDLLIQLLRIPDEKPSSSYRPIPLHLAQCILKRSTDAFKNHPIVGEPSIPTGMNGKAVIIGDLHASLKSLKLILQRHVPSDDTLIVINGDFVDRGPYSFVVFIIVCALKLVFPESVFLNRGNHEDEMIFNTYGLAVEVRQAYGMKDGQALLKLANEAMRWLPLATIIDKSFFVVHAGLTSTDPNPESSDTLEIANVEDIKKLQRPITPNHFSYRLDNTIASGLLWSDPKDCSSPRMMFHDVRGCGFAYYREQSMQFVENNGLKMIIRSHQMLAGGFFPSHCDVQGNQCHVVTVHSTVEYGGGETSDMASILLITLDPSENVSEDSKFPAPGYRLTQESVQL